MPVTYASSAPGVAAVMNNMDGTSTLRLLTEGIATITASQSGDADYEAATPVTQTITVQELTILRVTPEGDPLADGSSWASAMTLQAALGIAGVAGDQIWIAEGIYKPHAMDRTATFSILEGVLVYGGFAGTEAADFDPANNPRTGGATILSGDLAGNDIDRPAPDADPTTYDAARNDNSNTVVTISGTGATISGAGVTLDGLTITAGEGGNPADFNRGAGLYVEAAGAVLTDCTFTDHTADGNGGGAYFAETITLTDCAFTGNEADGSGGGISSFGGTSTVTLTGCTFTSNTANDNGGGISSFGGTGTSIVTLTGCTFTGNTANDNGGGAWLDVSATLTACTFTGNTADDNGGGARFNGAATLTSCTFNTNTVQQDGGGAYFAGTTTLTGCAFTGNTAENAGGAWLAGIPTLTNCVLVGNSAGDDAGGLLLNSGGTVINTTFYNNTAIGVGGGIGVGFLTNHPFTLQNSIFVGNTASEVGHQVYANNTDVMHVVNVRNNLIAGGETGAAAGIRYTDVGSGNITSTGTVDQSDATLVFASTDALNANYLRLRAGSLAVNTGDNSYIPVGITTDAAGNVRIQGGTVDMGAYESGMIPQTIAITSPAAGVVGGTIDLTVTTSTGLPVTFAITAGGSRATLAGTTLTLTGVGEVTITATQAGNADYAKVTTTQTITVSQGTQVVTFTSGDAGVVGTDIELMATASTGLPVTFAIAAGDAFATLADNGTTLTLTGVGEVTITATQAGNTNYAEATQTQDITVSQGTQTIAITSPAIGMVGGTIALIATASSGLPVTFAITAGDAFATLAGGDLTLTGVGEVTITATQAGNADYAMATATQTITVEVILQTTFTLGTVPIPNILMADNSGGRINGDIISNISTTPGGGVGRYISNPVNNGAGRWQIRINNVGAWIDLAEGSGLRKVRSNDFIRFLPTPGGTGRAVSLTVYVVRSNNPLDETYPDEAAARATYPNLSDPQVLTVTVISSMAQVITFTHPTGGAIVKVGETLGLMATTSATGLFVTFTTNPAGIATLLDDGADDGIGMLHFDAVGEVTVTASQAGDESGGVTYPPATSVTHTITVRSAGAAIFRVTTTGTGNGSSWAQAMSLHEALGIAIVAGDQIWIAEGIYTPHADDRSGDFPHSHRRIGLWGFCGRRSCTCRSFGWNNHLVG